MQCNPVAQPPAAHDAMHHGGAHVMKEKPNTMPGATQGARSRETRVLRSKKSILLWIGWVLAFALAAACFAVLLQGVARDARWGQPAIPLDFSEVSGWQSESFRVWGEDTYTLFVSSVNHDPEYIDRFLTADFRVRILGADEQPVLDRLYRGETLDHTVPRGYGDVRLATINIKGKPWRPGTLQVRVAGPGVQDDPERNQALEGTTGRGDGRPHQLRRDGARRHHAGPGATFRLDAGVARPQMAADRDGAAHSGHRYRFLGVTA